MDWGEEWWIKLYTRDTASWSMLSWEARALFLFILRKVDRAGVLGLGRHGISGLAVLMNMPTSVVEPALSTLIHDGCVTQRHAESHGVTDLVVNNFVEAQSRPTSSKTRKQMERSRKRSLAKSFNTGHAESRGVAICHPESRREENKERLFDPSKEPPHVDPVGQRAVVFGGAGKEEKSTDYIPIKGEDWSEIPAASPLPPLQLTLLDPEPPAKRSRIAPEALEAVYRLYPRREGKKAGLERLGRLLRDAADPTAKLAEVERAVRNYAALVVKENRDPTKIKLFSSFMGCWEDYATEEPPPLRIARPPVYDPPKPISDAERAEVSSMISNLTAKFRGGC